MKRTTLTLLIACGVFLGVGTALGATAKSVAREQAHHRLLKLALQDAAQHARTLHFQAHDPAQALDAEIMRGHMDGLGRDLEAIENEVKVIQDIDGDGERFDFHVAELHNHAALAREGIENLRLEAARPSPDQDQIDCWSATIFDHLTKAAVHHRRTMAAHRVIEPPRPTVNG